MENLEIKTNVEKYRASLRKSISKNGWRSILFSALSALSLAYAIIEKEPKLVLPKGYDIGMVHINRTDAIQDVLVGFAAIVSFPLAVRYLKRRSLTKNMYNSLESISLVIDPNKKVITENFAYRDSETFSRETRYTSIVDCYENNGDLEIIIKKPDGKPSGLKDREYEIAMPSVENPIESLEKIKQLVQK